MFIVTGFYKVGHSLFATTQQRGMWRSTDEGQSWQSINTGLPITSTTKLDVVSLAVSGNMMFVGTIAHGLWKRPLAELLPELDVAVTGSTGATLALSRSVPNPVESEAVIEYDLPGDGAMSLKLYDLYQHEMKTIVEGEQRRGHYRAVIRVEGLPSGMYFYRLSANGVSRTERMMIVR